MWSHPVAPRIAACAAQLEGRVSDQALAPLVLHDIYATRMAPHLQGPRLHLEEMELIEHFVAALPERPLDHSERSNCLRNTSKDGRKG